VRIPVFLDSADIACCMQVPSVGDRIRWSLIWSDEPDHPAATVIRWAVEQPLELDEEESRHIGVAAGTLLTHGPVSAWWRGAGGRALPQRGVLVAGAHGFVPERVPWIAGRAVEVSLVIGTDRETAWGTREQVADGTSVWPIADASSWEDWEDFADLAGPLLPGHDRGPRGAVVVVDLAR
jgi:hypothetical protein